MNRFLFVLLIGLALACSPKEEKTPPEKPNFIVIVADDMGWSDLSCYGNDFIETPNIDRLAKNGMRFTNGYAAASLCSPSRASLITGLHPVEANITIHIHGNHPARPSQQLKTPFIDQQLALKHTTIAERLTVHDYNTGFVGKWHLGGGTFAPHHRGFDVNIAGGYNALPNSFFYPFFRPGEKPEIQEEYGEGDYLTDVLTDKALSYLENQKDSTFFLYMAYYSPHVPIEAKEALVEKYRQKRGDKAADTTIMPNIHYAAMVESIDQNVGRILEFVEKSGLSDNTVIIFTSDNGGLHVRSIPGFDKHTPPMSNAPLFSGKGFTYEGGVRVPFIAKWPDGPSGVTTDKPVVGFDLYNTIMETVGDSTRTTYGASLLPIINQEEVPSRDIVWHSPHYTPQGQNPSSVVRSGDWKLIYYYESDAHELYDLANDPGESQNLAQQKPEKVEELRAILNRQLEEMDANLPEPNPDYVGDAQ